MDRAALTLPRAQDPSERGVFLAGLLWALALGGAVWLVTTRCEALLPRYPRLPCIGPATRLGLRLACWLREPVGQALLVALYGASLLPGAAPARRRQAFLLGALAASLCAGLATLCLELPFTRCAEPFRPVLWLAPAGEEAAPALLLAGLVLAIPTGALCLWAYARLLWTPPQTGLADLRASVWISFPPVVAVSCWGLERLDLPVLRALDPGFLLVPLPLACAGSLGLAFVCGVYGLRQQRRAGESRWILDPTERRLQVLGSGA